MSNDPRAAKYNPPAPLPCEYCGKLRHTRGIVLGNRIMWLPSGPEHCTCEKAQAELLAQEQAKQEAEAKRLAAEAAARQKARIAGIIGASGMGARFKNRVFEKYEQTPENINAYKAAVGYAANFARLLENPAAHEKNGLFFVGPRGTGKTHLAAAVANKLMTDGTPVLFATMIDLLGNIKATFNRENAKTNETDLMRLYKQVDLLIIDDMGKEQPTAWALTKMYEIINARYEDYKPIIVTSNYTTDELVKRLTPADGDNTTADATVDRILEMTYTAPLAGESWRTR